MRKFVILFLLMGLCLINVSCKDEPSGCRGHWRISYEHSNKVLKYISTGTVQGNTTKVSVIASRDSFFITEYIPLTEYIENNEIYIYKKDIVEGTYFYTFTKNGRSAYNLKTTRICIKQDTIIEATITLPINLQEINKDYLIIIYRASSNKVTRTLQISLDGFLENYNKLWLRY